MLIFMISKLQLKVSAFFQQPQASIVHTFSDLTLDESIHFWMQSKFKNEYL